MKFKTDSNESEWNIQLSNVTSLLLPEHLRVDLILILNTSPHIEKLNLQIGSNGKLINYDYVAKAIILSLYATSFCRQRKKTMYTLVTGVYACFHTLIYFNS